MHASSLVGSSGRCCRTTANSYRRLQRSGPMDRQAVHPHGREVAIDPPRWGSCRSNPQLDERCAAESRTRCSDANVASLARSSSQSAARSSAVAIEYAPSHTRAVQQREQSTIELRGIAPASRWALQVGQSSRSPLFRARRRLPVLKTAMTTSALEYPPDFLPAVVDFPDASSTSLMKPGCDAAAIDGKTNRHGADTIGRGIGARRARDIFATLPRKSGEKSSYMGRNSGARC